MIDVLISGAGPAGSVAAIVLARAGVSVRLVDRACFPRDKLCGDTINPGTVAILERLGLGGLIADGLPIDGMLVTGGGARVEARYGAGVIGCALRRAEFDARLLGEAVRAGVDVEDEVLVREPVFAGERVSGAIVCGRRVSGAVEARLVISAEGSGSRLARACGLASHPRSPRRWAVGACFDQVASRPIVDGRSVAMPRVGEMHVRRDRYVGISPLPGGITNVCVVSADRAALADPQALIAGTLAGETMFADRFAGARQTTTPVTLGPLAVDCRAAGAPGLLLAGDAAGFIDPMTGDGLHLACRGGELAAVAALDALARGPSASIDAHRRLHRARCAEFAAKWRFNRTLRIVAGHPAALTAAAAAARWFPRWLELAIRYAGDVAAGDREPHAAAVPSLR